MSGDVRCEAWSFVCISQVSMKPRHPEKFAVLHHVLEGMWGFDPPLDMVMLSKIDHADSLSSSTYTSAVVLVTAHSASCVLTGHPIDLQYLEGCDLCTRRKRPGSDQAYRILVRANLGLGWGGGGKGAFWTTIMRSFIALR